MKRLILFIVLFFFTKGIAIGVTMTDFKFQASIKGEEKHAVYVRLMLPFDIIKNTSTGFTDLRIFDDKGTEVPYVIYAQSRPKERPRSFSWEIVNYQYTDTTQIIILKRPKNIDIARDLQISTNARDFVREVKIYAGNDQKIWNLLATSSFFDFSSQVDFRKTKIDIPEIAGKYLKVMLSVITKSAVGGQRMRFQYKDLLFSLDGTVKREIKINRFSSYVGKRNKEKQLYDEIDIRTPETFIDKDSNTIVKLGKLNIPVDKVLLSIKNSYFYRDVELWIAEKDLDESYHISGKNVLYSIPDIKESRTAFHLQFVRPAYVRLKIINKDNPPLNVENVNLKWVRRNLYFMPENGRSYSLYWAGSNMNRPDYELERMIPNQYDRLMSYDEWKVGKIRKNTDYSPKADDRLSQRVQKYMFIGLVLLLVCGLGYWVFRLMKKLPANKED